MPTRNPITGRMYCNLSPHRMCGGHGILTVCPSGAAFAIPLGPTNPGLIVMARETLVFRCAGFSPALWLLVPAFSLLYAPSRVTPYSSSRNRTLSYRLHTSQERRTFFVHLKILTIFQYEKWSGWKESNLRPHIKKDGRLYFILSNIPKEHLFGKV